MPLKIIYLFMEKLEIQYDRWRVASIPKSYIFINDVPKEPNYSVPEREREKRERFWVLIGGLGGEDRR